MSLIDKPSEKFQHHHSRRFEQAEGPLPGGGAEFWETYREPTARRGQRRADLAFGLGALRWVAGVDGREVPPAL